MGLKPPDVMGAFGCSTCHDAVDGRIQTEYTREQLQLMHALGVFRTQAYWIKHDMIQVKGARQC